MAFPFRMLVIGDFGAHAATGRPVEVDRDNFDTVMNRLGVRLTYASGTLQFRELDDFHPDRLLTSDLFGTVAAAPAPEAPLRPSPQPVARPDVEALLGSGSLLDAITASDQPVRQRDPLQSFIESAVAPHTVHAPTAEELNRQATKDARVSTALRALLRERQFQALESAWRALFFLVRRVETSADFKIFLLHLPKRAAAADIGDASDLRETALFRVLVRDAVQIPGAEPWAAIVANYTFGPGAADIGLLGRMALLASAVGAPFMAGAGAELLGDDAGMASWNELRRIPEARYLGLALPRFLLRLPYGRDTSPIETFDFEEMPGAPEHSAYLWGNAAFACAALLAEGSDLDLTDLPAHVYREDGESVIQPCAEVLMTEGEAEALIDRGLMPLVSIKNTDRARLAGFRSIADPPAALQSRAHKQAGAFD